MKFRSVVLTAILLAGAVSSCAWHNMEEDVIPPPTTGDPCDSIAATFADTILPILTTSCSPSGSGTGCHLAGNGSRPTISDYTNIKDLVDLGRLEARVFNEDPSPMPPSGATALTACQKELIQRWIDAGALDN